LADTEVIRQFLVSIGVQVDEKGLKRFDQTVRGITKTATEFAEAMAAAAAAVSAAVVKVSADFEDLYYASQRLKSSVDNIKAFGFGVSQMGGDAKAARASLESFASFMRSNPMGEGVVRGMGVETRDGAGGLREYADVLRDVGAQLRRMPYWAARQRANLLGIDENTLQALLRGTDIWSERYRKLVADNGVNMDQMAADATNLMQSFRLLRAEIEIYFYKAVQKINPQVLALSVGVAAVAGALALVATLLGPEIAAILALGAAIALLADDFDGWKNGADSLIDWGPFADSIDAAVDSIGNLLSSLGDLAKALGGIRDTLTAFTDAVNTMVRIAIVPIDYLAGLIRTIAALLNGDLPAAFANAARANRQAANDMIAAWTAVRHFMGDFKDGLAGNPNTPTQGTGTSSQARARALAGGGANDNTPAGRSAVAQAMAYFMRQGWTREQAAGIVANLNAESGIKANGPPGDGGGARGVAQWHADRQADFRAFAGKDLSQANLAEQLAFVNYELTRGRYAAAGRALRSATSARTAGAVVSSRYERPGDVRGEMMRRGSSAEAILAASRLGTDSGARTVIIHSKTDVKVTGAADAQATGKAVGSAVDQSTGNLVRNTKSAVH
jgi:hypothetical protein